MITNICPDIPDNWRGGRSATAKILGISVKTLDRHSAIGRYHRGIRYTINPRNGRRVYTGKEIKKFWYDMT